jgi:hypothetical protein
VSDQLLRVSDLCSSVSAAGLSRVQALVDGHLLWFESEDAILAPAPEAFASAFLIPAAASNLALKIDAAIDIQWLNQAPAILKLVSNWWGVRKIQILAEPCAGVPCEAPGQSAQCFTGGVDSFYTLTTTTPPPNILVFGHGYDIPLTDQKRLDAFRPSLRETAAAFSARSVVIRSNLRSHPAFRQVSWEWSHGGALAALGHLLCNQVDKLIVPSSYPYHDEKPWGTHWDLDPLWSSSRLEVKHADATLRRNGKVREIVKHPVAMKGLRVCWENRSPTGNCSVCEKCVRTMLALHICGQLNCCQTFDLSVPIEQRLDALVVPAHLRNVYEELREEIDDRTVRDSVDRLIRRRESVGHKFVRRVRGVVRNLFASYGI